MSRRQPKIGPKPLEWDNSVQNDAGPSSNPVRNALYGTHMSTAERIRYALSLVTDGRIVGRSAKQLARYAAGADVPLSVLSSISAASGLSIEWLATGHSPTRPAEEEAAGLDTVPIRFAEVRASAGHGSVIVDDDLEPRYVDFPKIILDNIAIKPEDARLMEAAGTSMLPTIGDGELLLVDVSERRRTAINDGKVYVFSVGDNVFCKRLRRTSRGVAMKGDNRELFPEEELIAEPFRIFGQALWAGRRL